MNLPSIIFSPFCSKFESISLRITGVLFKIKAVAIPEPIKPPPIMATLFIFLGLIPTSVTLGTCQRQLNDRKLIISRKLRFKFETHPDSLLMENPSHERK